MYNLILNYWVTKHSTFEAKNTTLVLNGHEENELFKQSHLNTLTEDEVYDQSHDQGDGQYAVEEEKGQPGSLVREEAEANGQHRQDGGNQQANVHHCLYRSLWG